MGLHEDNSLQVVATKRGITPITMTNRIARRYQPLLRGDREVAGSEAARIMTMQQRAPERGDWNSNHAPIAPFRALTRISYSTGS